MGATEDFLAEMQRRRKQQLDAIRNMFQAPQAADPQMAPASGRPSVIGGLLKTRASQQIGLASQPEIANILGNVSTPLTTPSSNAWLSSQGASVPAGVGTQGSGILGGLQSAGTAIGQGASAVGSGLSSAAGAVGSALGQAGSGIASLISAIFSSRRLKHEIETYRQIGDLRWVFFKYLPEIDPDQTPLLGLIAEEVYETRPEVVCLDEMGDPIAIQYDMIPDEDWPSIDQAMDDLRKMIPWH